MKKFKGLNYWLGLADNDELLQNNISKLIEQIENGNADPDSLLDLSIALELIGNEQSIDMQNYALETKQIYSLHPKSSHNKLKFLKKMYDARTGEPNTPDPILLVLKTNGSISNNMSLELYCHDVVLDNAYITNQVNLNISRNWEGVVIGIAPLEQNILLLEYLTNLLEELPLPVLNHPRSILNLIPTTLTKIISRINNTSYLFNYQQLESLRSNDGYFYEYNLFYVSGSFYIHSVNIARNTENLASQKEMLANPKLFLIEKKMMLDYQNFQSQHQAKLEAISSELNLDIFILSCFSPGDNELIITNINTNQILETTGKNFSSHRKAYIENIIDAITDTLYFLRVKNDKS